ncbi:LysR family transcriptional regulator [Acinetobacter sp. A1-4-2]|uniref:LysR family transcriptional regulator n=1 Tax=Acinetobacter sp. A1-4-2 TaxID=3156489 RepID=A0AAU7T084_9GAMM
MELKTLKYFVTVVEEKSITKAASKLCMAQPPLTRQIKNLESQLGVTLFERGTRPVKTTEVGQYFYQYAVQILTLSAHAKSMVNRYKVTDTTVRIGYVSSLFYWKLPELIDYLRRNINGIKVELVECGTREQVEALKLGKIDIGFGRLGISDPSIKRTILEHERLLLAVHNDHALGYYHNEGIYLSQILSEIIYIYPNTPKPNFSTFIQNIFSELDLIPQSLTEVREIHMALGLVSSSEGVCIIPKSASAIGIKNLKFLPILDEEAYSPITLAYRSIDNNEYIQQILEYMSDF